MATKTKKVYNLNEMRDVLLNAHKDGNSRLIGKKEATENGVTEGFYALYIGRSKALYDAICLYVRTKHANSKQISEYGGADEWKSLLKEQREAIFPLWKAMLECGEKTKTAKSLHLVPEDIDSLVGFAEMFMATANTPLNAEKEEVYPKAIAPVTFSKFRKKVETLLGIRIAEEAVMTDEKRDYLLAESRLIRKIKRATKNIKETTEQIAEIERVKKFIKNNSELANLNNKIEMLQAMINGTPEKGKNFETVLADAKKELKDLYDKNGVNTKGLDLETETVSEAA